MRYFLLITLIALSISVIAQEDEDEQPVREIYTVLAYGDDVFEPDLWLVTAQEKELRTTAHWQAGSINAWAYLDFLHFDGEISPDDFDETFDEFWFEGTFANYDSYEETERCVFEDGTVLIYFEVEDNTLDYLMRYWLIPASATRVAAMFIGFPADDEISLVEYSESFLPDRYECKV